MTERLYETSPEMNICTAKVISVLVDGANCWLELDRTVLFPEGGGQLCDTGAIDGTAVTAVKEIDGRILHRCAADLTEGDTVTIELDREVRDCHSRQHTAEHMLSHAFWKLFGVNNVGFHSGENSITIDLDGEVTREQCLQAELFANEQIWQNKPVEIIYRDKDDMSDMAVRKVTDKADGIVRVVVIADGDVCTCCGTHVAATGCIGAIKIVDIQRHRGGMRIEAVCGRQALEDYAEKSELLYRLNCELSCGGVGMLDRIASMKAESRSLSARISKLSAKLMDFTAAQALSGCGEAKGIKCVMAAIEGTQNEAKQLLNRLTASGEVMAGVFFENDGRIGYMVSKTRGVKVSCRDVSAIANGLLNGKGGGSETFAQGSGKLTSDWKDLVQMVESAVLRMI